jgi:hypothetical protein
MTRFMHESHHAPRCGEQGDENSHPRKH